MPTLTTTDHGEIHVSHHQVTRMAERLWRLGSPALARPGRSGLGVRLGGRVAAGCSCVRAGGVSQNPPLGG